MSDKLKNLLVRTASALAFGGAFVAAVWFSKWSLGVALALILCVGVVEFYKICRKSGSEPMGTMGVALSIALFGMAFTIFYQWGTPFADLSSRIVYGLLLYIMLMLPAVFVCELWRKSSTPLLNIATTIMGVVYVALPMSLLLFIPQLLVGEWSPKALLAYIVIIWANDIFAYLVGVTIGKHRLCERISPKKSWEGFVGGVVGAIGIAVLMGYLFDGNLYLWGGLGLIVALTGVAGDLVESMLKRSAEMKDSGAIIPGHGGVLDRFDALLLSTPFAFIYLIILKNLIQI